jgi:UDP-3-O-[3-hydroxymyristoyl] glucosamine N-acyltransferase
MVDTRFHESSGPVDLASLLASLPVAPVVDMRRASEIVISGVDELAVADIGHIALAASAEYREPLRSTLASAVIVSPALRDLVPKSAVAIVSDRPHALFVDILERLYRRSTRPNWGEGDDTAPLLEAGVSISANVVIGPGVEIGRNTVIAPNTTIGAGVAIGRNCVIGPNVTVEYAYLGNNVVLNAGCRIGSEGFGWLDQGRGNRKIPQLGRAILQDGVEIGANSTVDRGALGDTVVGEGTKVDNLVQIGHNCRIGRYCLIAGTAALGGGTIVGDGVLIAGGVGTVGHLRVGDGSILSARSLVTKDVPAGQRVAGYPAQDYREWQREIVGLRLNNKRGRDDGRN